MRPLTRRILVADDDQLILDIVRQTLQGDRFDVVAAKNGQAALQEVRIHKPALIILDSSMPVIDGLAALAALKADATTKAIPVLMLTARRSAEDVRRAQSLGACGYIAKPFETRVLLARVEAALRGGGQSITRAPVRDISDLEYID